MNETQTVSPKRSFKKFKLSAKKPTNLVSNERNSFMLRTLSLVSFGLLFSAALSAQGIPQHPQPEPTCGAACPQCMQAQFPGQCKAHCPNQFECLNCCRMITRNMPAEAWYGCVDLCTQKPVAPPATPGSTQSGEDDWEEFEEEFYQEFE